MRKDGAGHVHRAENVDVELVLYGVARRGLKQAEQAVAGVVDHCVDAPEMADPQPTRRRDRSVFR
jgi:hypothetical protein